MRNRENTPSLDAHGLRRSFCLEYFLVYRRIMCRFALPLWWFYSVFDLNASSHWPLHVTMRVVVGIWIFQFKRFFKYAWVRRYFYEFTAFNCLLPMTALNIMMLQLTEPVRSTYVAGLMLTGVSLTSMFAFSPRSHLIFTLFGYLPACLLYLRDGPFFMANTLFGFIVVRCVLAYPTMVKAVYQAHLRNTLRTEVERLRVSLQKSYDERLKIVSESLVARSVADAARMIAHDIRSPFASLDMILQQLKEPYDRAKVYRFIDRVRTSTAYVDQLLRNLISQEGVSSNNYARVSLRSVIEDSWSQVPDHRKATVALDVSGVIPIDVWADRTKVIRVFSNLFNNALDAMDAGATTIWVQADSVNVDGDSHSRISVINSGWIDEQVLSRLFDKHFTTKLDGSGNGLGLVICRSIVESHGGAIECQLLEGRRSAFIFTLPERAFRSDAKKVLIESFVEDAQGQPLPSESS